MGKRGNLYHVTRGTGERPGGLNYLKFWNGITPSNAVKWVQGNANFIIQCTSCHSYCHKSSMINLFKILKLNLPNGIVLPPFSQ